MPDHVHVLIRLHTTVAVADLLKEIKGASSHLVTHEVTPEQFFKWQGAYGAFTVSKSGAARVRAYIGNQKAHHAASNLWADYEQVMTDSEEGPFKSA